MSVSLSQFFDYARKVAFWLTGRKGALVGVKWQSHSFCACFHRKKNPSEEGAGAPLTPKPRVHAKNKSISRALLSAPDHGVRTCAKHEGERACLFTFALFSISAQLFQPIALLRIGIFFSSQITPRQMVRVSRDTNGISRIGLSVVTLNWNPNNPFWNPSSNIT